MVADFAMSPEAISILKKTIKNGAAANKLSDALEIGYQGAAEIVCTHSAREGIAAFMEKTGI